MTRLDIKSWDFDQWIAGWRGPALAALVALVAGLPSLMLLPPLDRDESRFAEATAQMLESRDFVDIRFQEEPRYKKPVGIYWMQAAAVAVTSNAAERDIRPYRLPSLFGAMIAAAAVVWAGAALFGRRAGFLAGAILGATFLLSSEAGIAKTDAMLCASVTLAMAALSRIYMACRAGEAPDRRHKFLFWLGLGVSILVKGPIGLLVVGLAVIALTVWDRDARWLKKLGWGWGLPLTLLIVGPWAIAITIATDGDFWREAVGHDLGGKITGAQESHGGLPGMYVLLSPLLLFPVTLLLPAAVSTAWSRRNDPAVRFAVCWLVPGWLMFELAPTKLWHYTLPTFGAIALLAAAALAQPIGRLSRVIGAGLGLFAAVVISAIAIYGLTEFGSSTAQTWAAMTVVLALAAGAIGGFLLLNKAPLGAVAYALGLGVLAHACLAGEIRQLRPLSIAPRLERALQDAGIDPRQGRVAGPVAITTFHEPSFVFLQGRDTQLTDAEGAARALSEGRPAIVEARDADAFRHAAARWGVAGRATGVVTGHNYSSGDDVSLTVYAPPSPVRAAR
ncbi:4-amino-4-deoxy-L-arabinose transferase [Brevundimonas sp. Leaf363]|uniref:ArnT family glycosyltransferase n=1 Tax=Brevundimonas sp. Leaf363 TaxID=1736353 RepID=UPI0006F2F7A1|nr:glycosyltransferase family 39 protein [Brevundimonas sp. Leaf363]KQS52899.1 4-amino-4-deoxy-L-arabinose transferase [Brevundimonas sp. Leaf363]